MKIIWYKLLLFSVLLSSLYGCVAAVGGATIGATSSAVIYDQRPVKQIMHDENISYQISTALQKNSDINTQCHIVVSTFHNIALLTGQAPTQDLQKTAVEIAKKIPGILRLYNEISIEGPTSNLTRSSDAWITTKIKANFIATKDLRSGQFKVVTENGVIYLMGITTKEQAQLAVDTARQIDGVQKVVTIFEYTHTDVAAK